MFVTNTDSNTVSVLDPATNTRLRNDSVGRRPVGLAVTPDGSKVLVANNNSGTVSVLDVGSDKLIQTIRAGTGPSGIAITPDGTRTYVSNVDSNDVSVLDTSTGKVDSINRTTTIGVGAHPLGVAVSPDGDKVYVPGNGTRKTSVIKTSDNTVTTADVARGPAAVATGRPQELSAIVTLGDSFISGVAGRWQGNGLRSDLLTDVHGTDRSVFACEADYYDAPCSYDARLVYGNSYQKAAGCMHSNVAEAQSSGIPVYRRINMACSGAETANIIDQPLKGEAPQSQQLAALLPHYKIKMIVLNIGGNNLGFRELITNCVYAFLEGGDKCYHTEDPLLREHIGSAQPRAAAAVDKVRDVMRAGGAPDSSYRLVLQSYPSPIPYGNEFRYPETYQRYQTRGCAVYNTDSTWVRGAVVPLIGTMIQNVAHQKNTEYLDVADLFNGHEVCSIKDKQAEKQNYHENPCQAATPSGPVSSTAPRVFARAIKTNPSIPTTTASKHSAPA